MWEETNFRRNRSEIGEEYEALDADCDRQACGKGDYAAKGKYRIKNHSVPRRSYAHARLGERCIQPVLRNAVLESRVEKELPTPLRHVIIQLERKLLAMTHGLIEPPRHPSEWSYLSPLYHKNTIKISCPNPFSRLLRSFS